MTTTAEKWSVRVDAWRRSGVGARSFCEGRDFSESGLRYWASRLRRETSGESKPAVRLARIVGATSGADIDTPIVIEVASVRVGVRRGFDREALRAVLELVGERESSR
jgi:hypothetical protein